MTKSMNAFELFSPIKTIAIDNELLEADDDDFDEQKDNDDKCNDSSNSIQFPDIEISTVIS